MPLTQEEIDGCRDAFLAFDKDRRCDVNRRMQLVDLWLLDDLKSLQTICCPPGSHSGSIDVWELRQVLEAMGQKPTEEELFQMISEVDDNMSGAIDFGEYL